MVIVHGLAAACSKCRLTLQSRGRAPASRATPLISNGRPHDASRQVRVVQAAHLSLESILRSLWHAGSTFGERRHGLHIGRQGSPVHCCCAVGDRRAILGVWGGCGSGYGGRSALYCNSSALVAAASIEALRCRDLILRTPSCLYPLRRRTVLLQPSFLLHGCIRRRRRHKVVRVSSNYSNQTNAHARPLPSVAPDLCNGDLRG